MKNEYMCSNCDTPHDNAEDAVMCCQCERCAELEAQLEAYCEATAELTDEDTFNMIESQYQERLKAAIGEES